MYYVNQHVRADSGSSNLALNSLPFAISLVVLSVMVMLPLEACSDVPEHGGSQSAPLSEVTGGAQRSEPLELDDESVKELLLAVALGDSLSEELARVADAFLSLSHDELIERALKHVNQGQHGRAELELIVVVAGADTSLARSYEQLSLLGYAQLMSDRKEHAVASLIQAGDTYTHLADSVNPNFGSAVAARLGFAYVEIGRGAEGVDKETSGRQAALWWARAGADHHLSSLGDLGPDELMIAAWAYGQTGRLDRATVFVARARVQYRTRIAGDPGDDDAHLGLARSYDASVTSMHSSSNPDSAAFHYARAGLTP